MDVSPKQAKQTPLMKQYSRIKKKYADCIVLFRVGDFYETFDQDAHTAARILGITLTKRANGAASHIALAGFPHHALDTYLPKLVKAGKRVAVCDQLEDPKLTKTIVKRGVTELVTPGVVLHDQVTDGQSNHFLSAVYTHKDEYGIAFLDFSTGDVFFKQGAKAFIESALHTHTPSEVIFDKSQAHLLSWIKDAYPNYGMDAWVFDFDFAKEQILRQYEVYSLKSFGLEDFPMASIAVGSILHYLHQAQHHRLKHLKAPTNIPSDKYLWMDKFSMRNLELFVSNAEDSHPLVKVIDKTMSAMGARMLKRWLALPLLDEVKIMDRQKVIKAFLSQKEVLSEIKAKLKSMADLERLAVKISLNRANPKDLLGLHQALKTSLEIKAVLSQGDKPVFSKMALALQVPEAVIQKIEKEIDSSAPALLSKKGTVIKSGVDKNLDHWRDLVYGDKNHLSLLQQKETEQTGISSLKIGFNNVFGYYFEVRNVHKQKVPKEWIRKQTLVSAERYITPELKTYEDKILLAQQEIEQLEHSLYQQLLKFIQNFVAKIQALSIQIASIDVLHSFADIAQLYDYHAPEFVSQPIIELIGARHAVIEQNMPQGQSYIPNNLYLDTQTQQILVITGPNMSGKSAFLRQTALIVILAQIGSFVPAEKAKFKIVNKIFTRIGASDNLSLGESTFMVEMNETAKILNNLSGNSLVLLDEIGRGTSTYDGVSIAWAIASFLHSVKGCKPLTLFSTHYHELNMLAERYARIKNFHFTVKQDGNKIWFLRKLQAGGSEHSFGIHVAKMAGLPKEVIRESEKILNALEQKQSLRQNNLFFKNQAFSNNPQQKEVLKEDYSDIVAEIKKIDIENITPLAAFNKLMEWKKKSSSTP